MVTRFFMAMEPPSTTAQMHKIGVRGGKPFLYDPPEVKDARAKLRAHLAGHVPAEPYRCGVELRVKWCFPRGTHRDGAYRTTRPDITNLQKLLEDEMTKLGYWEDDALIVSAMTEKFWATVPGIFICITPISDLRGE